MSREIDTLFPTFSWLQIKTCMMRMITLCCPNLLKTSDEKMALENFVCQKL